MSNQGSQRARYEFKRVLEELEDVRGQGTELISLYIPPDKNLHDVVAQLRDERGQAQNIKSKGTRKNVSAALDSILGRLKNFDSVPDNGLVLFVGHAVRKGDQTEMVQHILEPPRQIGMFTYNCDSTFLLEPLEDLLEEHNVYGLLVVDRSEATIGFLRGSRVEVVANLQSQVPSKHSKGGQSHRRFERLIEEAADNFFKKVAEKADTAFLAEDNLKGVLVGGPGATKDQFVDKQLLHHEVQQSIVDTFDTGYTDEYGLRDLVHNAQDTLRQMGLMEEKDLMQRFLKEVSKPSAGLSAYGEDHVRQAVQLGAVDTLILSENLRRVRGTIHCPSCGWEQDVTVEKRKELDEHVDACPECESATEIAEMEDLVEELTAKAEDMGGSVEIVSPESEEGELLWNAFGGVAAILRFELDLHQVQ